MSSQPMTAFKLVVAAVVLSLAVEATVGANRSLATVVGTKFLFLLRLRAGRAARGGPSRADPSDGQQHC